MREIIILMIIILSANIVYALEPSNNSATHLWTKPLEISKGLGYDAKLGKEKPSTISLSRLPESVLSSRPTLPDNNESARVNETTVNETTVDETKGATSKVVTQPEDHASPKLLQPSNQVGPRITQIKDNSQPLLHGYRDIFSLGQTLLVLPSEYDLICGWGSRDHPIRFPDSCRCDGCSSC